MIFPKEFLHVLKIGFTQLCDRVDARCLVDSLEESSFGLWQSCSRVPYLGCQPIKAVVDIGNGV